MGARQWITLMCSARSFFCRPSDSAVMNAAINSVDMTLALVDGRMWHVTNSDTKVLSVILIMRYTFSCKWLAHESLALSSTKSMLMKTSPT